MKRKVNSLAPSARKRAAEEGPTQAAAGSNRFLTQIEGVPVVRECAKLLQEFGIELDCG